MAQRFEFISVSGTRLKGDDTTRRRIRSHAQADYRRRNPPPPRPPLSVALDVSPWLNQLSREPMDGKSQNARRLLATRSGSGIVPSLPSKAQPRARLLWGHLYDSGCVLFKSMIEIGFLDNLRGSSALMQMLSSAAYHMSNERPQLGTETTESARYSLVALQSLQTAIRNRPSLTNLEVVMAILAFAAFAHLIGDAQLINLHLDGLSQALGQWGGSIENVLCLRMMTYWIDLHSALLQDMTPRYPQPHFLDEYRQLSLSTADGLDPVASIVQGMRQLNVLIDAQFAQQDEELWKSPLFIGFNVDPLIYRLLSMQRATPDVQSRRRECFRLAAIIYLLEVRQKFAFDPYPAKMYVAKLKGMLRSPGILPTSDHLLCWSLLVGSSAMCVGHHRQDFLQMLRSSFVDYQDRGMWAHAVLDPTVALTELSVHERSAHYLSSQEN